MYKCIIVGVEIGALDKGEKILRKASSLLDPGGRIVLVNIVEDLPLYVTVELPPDLLENAEKDARDKLSELVSRTGIAAACEIAHGSAASGLLEAAERHKADLVVLASHVPDFSNYFIGATADRVVRHARCSVLVDR